MASVKQKDFDLANAKSCLPRRSLLWFKNRPWKPICHSQKDVVKGVFSAGKPAKTSSMAQKCVSLPLLLPRGGEHCGSGDFNSLVSTHIL